MFRIFIGFYTCSKKSQSLLFISNSANSVLKTPCSLNHLLTCKVFLQGKHCMQLLPQHWTFSFCVRPFALHCQQTEKDKQNVDFAPPAKISADAHDSRPMQPPRPDLPPMPPSTVAGATGNEAITCSYSNFWTRSKSKPK